MGGNDVSKGEKGAVPALGNAAAERYLWWLYRYASSRPDLTLLARVAGAVAALERPPANLAASLHDEVAIAMAALDSRRP